MAPTTGNSMYRPYYAVEFSQILPAIWKQAIIDKSAGGFASETLRHVGYGVGFVASARRCGMASAGSPVLRPVKATLAGGGARVAAGGSCGDLGVEVKRGGGESVGGQRLWVSGYGAERGGRQIIVSE